MLVLSMHRHQSIVISDSITVTVMEIRGDKVRLGIEAPNEIPINRQEIHDKILKERQAVQSASES